jgi:hypothetical protein
MKHIITLLALITGLLLVGCGTDNKEHPHGEDGDHTHEQPATNSTKNQSEPVRIGNNAQSNEEASEHSHDEDSDHDHGDTAAKDSTDQQSEGHSHGEDADHDH